MAKKEIKKVVFFSLMAAVITGAISTSTLILVSRNKEKSVLPTEEVVVDETTPTPIMYGNYTYDQYIRMLEDEVNQYKDILNDSYTRWDSLNSEYNELSSSYEKLQEKVHIYEENASRLYNDRYRYAIAEGDNIDYSFIIYIENKIRDNIMNDLDFYLCLLLVEYRGEVLSDPYGTMDQIIDKIESICAITYNPEEILRMYDPENNSLCGYMEGAYAINTSKTFSDLQEIIASRTKARRN